MDDALSIDVKMQKKSDRRKGGVWRWVFICAIAFDATMAVLNKLSMLQPGLISARIFSKEALWVLLPTELFLMFGSPFFLKRLGLLARCGWITAFAVLPFYFIPASSGSSPRMLAIDDERQLVSAINYFYQDRGYYPCAKNKGDDTQDYFVDGGAGEAQLLNILGDKNPDDTVVKKYNPQGTIYLYMRSANDLNHPKRGIGSDGVLYDPWGNPYLIKIDSNYNGIILNPYSANAGPAQLKAGVIVWSLGPDGTGATSSTGNGDKNSGVNSDAVISWQ